MQINKEIGVQSSTAKYRLPSLLAGLAVLVWGCGCDTKGPEPYTVVQHEIKSDKPLTEDQTRLLNMAIETASMIPINPHNKDRSRAQEAVVATCLKLNQPSLAAEYLVRIEDWRQGYCYADLAFYCARQGFVNQAVDYLNRAERAGSPAEDWRKDTIKVRMAQTWAVLGKEEQAHQYETDLEDSQKSKVAGAKAVICEDASFDQQIKSLEALSAGGGYDVLKNIQEAYVQLYRRFYHDVQRRQQIREKMKAAQNGLPVITQIELRLMLAESALEHNDRSVALEEVCQARQLVDGNQWRPEYQVSIIARLSAIRYRAGDTKNAHRECDLALAYYDAQRLQIVDIYRAESLIDVAQAYMVMGDGDTSLRVFKRAVEESVENPNSRPRAEDVTAVCCSMALYQVKADSQLWSRLRQVQEGLGQPW